jgi:hypothetical protein
MRKLPREPCTADKLLACGRLAMAPWNGHRGRQLAAASTLQTRARDKLHARSKQRSRSAVAVYRISTASNDIDAVVDSGETTVRFTTDDADLRLWAVSRVHHVTWRMLTDMTMASQTRRMRAERPKPPLKSSGLATPWNNKGVCSRNGTCACYAADSTGLWVGATCNDCAAATWERPRRPPRDQARRAITVRDGAAAALRDARERAQPTNWICSAPAATWRRRRWTSRRTSHRGWTTML